MRTICACAIAALLLAACGGKYSTPESTVRTMLAAIEAEDEAAARECIVTVERKEGRKVVANDSKRMTEKGYKVGSATIDGDRAKVPVTFKDKNSDGDETTVNVVCKREDGDWKVSMKETFSNMFKEAMSGLADKITGE